MNERLSLLVKDKVNLLKTKSVLIIGLGGVGGYALEAIVRSGIEHVIIVDFDSVEESNLNRQLLSLRDNIGLKKVDIAYNRIKNINPSCKVDIIDEFINLDNIDLLFKKRIDYLIDACDTLTVKKEIIRKCLKNKIKFISSMGTGNKFDPSKLEIIDIRKTSYDPLAKEVRKMVKDEGIKDKIMVVSSSEPPIKTNSRKVGSNAFVPGVAGLLCASFVVNDILGDNFDR